MNFAESAMTMLSDGSRLQINFGKLRTDMLLILNITGMTENPSTSKNLGGKEK